jgi:outer membrane protein TolC
MSEPFRSLLVHLLSIGSVKWPLVFLALVLLVLPDQAFALQPLEEFFAAARTASMDQQEAALLASQQEAQARAMRDHLLPSLSFNGTWSRNQYEAVLNEGTAAEIVVQPRDGLSGSALVSIPIVDLSTWASVRASNDTARAAHHATEDTSLVVNRLVAQSYYQLAGIEALLLSTKQTLFVAEENQEHILARREEGSATDLDVARATVEVEGARRDLADLDLSALLARRTLTTLTGLTPSGEVQDVSDDLHEETPLGEWEKKVDALPAVRAAALQVLAAEHQSRASWLGMAPSLSASAIEEATNSAGFVGHSTYYTAMATLSWKLGLSTAAQARIQDLAAAIAQVQLDRVRQAAMDSIHESWQRVRMGLLRSRAARAQAEAARLATQSASERYAAGAGTQLELIQAQRDLSSAEAARIQADADLALDRILLRLSVGEI